MTKDLCRNLFPTISNQTHLRDSVFVDDSANLGNNSCIQIMLDPNLNTQMKCTLLHVLVSWEAHMFIEHHYRKLKERDPQGSKKVFFASCGRFLRTHISCTVISFDRECTFSKMIHWEMLYAPFRPLFRHRRSAFRN